MTTTEKSRVSAIWLFRSTEYLVSSSVRDNVLEVQVEETLSTDQWRGRFEAKRKSSHGVEYVQTHTYKQLH